MSANRAVSTKSVLQILTPIGIAGLLSILPGLISCEPRSYLTICKKSIPLATAISLESAVNNFFIEYGMMPVDLPRVTTDSPDGKRFLTILLGTENPTGKPVNERSIKFLNLREGKDRRGGLIFSPTGNAVEALLDQWGNPYTVILDIDYNNHLTFMMGPKTVELEGRRFAAFSPGPDRMLGTADDVKTWD